MPSLSELLKSTALSSRPLPPFAPAAPQPTAGLPQLIATAQQQTDAGAAAKPTDKYASARPPPPAEMSQMDWASLYRMRVKYQDDPAMQELIAPFEHQAWAREMGADNPLVGAAYAAGVIPAYQLAKMAGLTDSDKMTTPPSLDQVFGGLTGAGQGLSQYLQSLTK